MATKKTKKTQKLDEQPGQSDPQAPLDAGLLLRAAQPLLKALAEDLLERARQSEAIAATLRERHAAEQSQERTADPYEVWLRFFTKQVAAAWFLSCVFVRVLEDRGLVQQARIAGPGALDSQQLFFELAPSLSERDYLLTVFRELSTLPGARELFDTKHNPVWLLAPSAERASALLQLFRMPSAEAPALRFGQVDTRFLGDLYQDLDEDVRERFALLQTPHFIESFILDRTLERAIERFGLDDTTLIDPTCGSGHFLLGAFERLFEHRLRAEPGLDVRAAAHKALDAVYGSDINPYAIAIARFRLTLAYLEKAGFRRLEDAPKLPLHLAVADSLLHNPQRKLAYERATEHQQQVSFGEHRLEERTAWERSSLYELEDPEAVRDVLYREHAAVVGNPPYVTVKDKALRDKYRGMYPQSAIREYSLAAPMVERFFQLGREHARIGMITANSFMKREFGKALVERFLPLVDLDLVVNTSGAFIPGHGTPTVLLFGNASGPNGIDVLTILAKRGEPSTPDEPAKGKVWSSVVAHWSELGFDNDYISVAKSHRTTLSKHPWSLGGGGASTLKELLEQRSVARLGEVVDLIGFGAVTREDEVFVFPRGAAHRWGLSSDCVAEYGYGEVVRDWSTSHELDIVFPYTTEGTRMPAELGRWWKLAWCYRTQLWERQGKGFKTKRDAGGEFYEYSMFYPDRQFTPLKIAFAFVATHNHFVLDRGGKVFNRSAPIIKLPESATEDDHLALLAYLNSSTACFWMKQVFFDKGNRGEGGGLTAEEWEKFFEFDGTKLQQFPIPVASPAQKKEAADRVRKLEDAAAKRSALSNLSSLLDESSSADELRRRLDSRLGDISRCEDLIRGLSESLDWWVYAQYGLADIDQIPEEKPCPPGTRLSDILFARRVLAGEVGRRYFELCRLPSPEAICCDAEDQTERMRLVESSPELSLIESPTFKRSYREGFRPRAYASKSHGWSPIT